MIHEAGPLGPDKLQRCCRCGALLKDLRVRGVDVAPDGFGSVGGPYPEGALVEARPAFQAMALALDAAADCGKEEP